MPKIRLSSKTTPLEVNIGGVRADKGWTMVATAKRLGIPPGTYGAYESGHSLPSKVMLDKMCKTFKCKPEDLYPDSEKESKRYILDRIEGYAIMSTFFRAEGFAAEAEADDEEVVDVGVE